MDQTLSLYLIETLPQLDAASPEHALDVLTLVESILENPELILRRQLDRIKDRAVAQMKADGVEHEQRMEELEKLEYPKPLRDFVYQTFNAFADTHPWVGEENIRPKSIAREMFENFPLLRRVRARLRAAAIEGLLLRHLNSVYKVLSQTVLTGSRPARSPTWSCTSGPSSAGSTPASRTSGSECAIPTPSPSPRDLQRQGRPATRPWLRMSRATRRPSPPQSGRSCSPSCARGAPAVTPPPSRRSTRFHLSSPKGAHGRRSGCDQRSKTTASTTKASVSIPRRETSAHPRPCDRGRANVARGAGAGRRRTAQ